MSCLTCTGGRKAPPLPSSPAAKYPRPPIVEPFSNEAPDWMASNKWESGGKTPPPKPRR